MWAQLTDLPPDPSAAVPELPPAFGPTLLDGLAKDPAARPASARDYVRSLCDAAGIAPPAALG